MLKCGRYEQCFVFVLCQDLVIGFQTVSANKGEYKEALVFPSHQKHMPSQALLFLPI